jgi:superkiller protein 3
MATKETLCDAAVDLFGDGKIDEAIAAYQEALGLDPDYLEALHGLAMAYSSKGDYEGAIEIGRRVCRLTPDDPLGHASLSMALHRQGRIAEAEAEGAAARRLLDTEPPNKGDSG